MEPNLIKISPDRKKIFQQSTSIVIKVGSSLLVEDKLGAIKKKWFASFIEDIIELRKLGKTVIIVSSGAINLGRKILNLKDNDLKLINNIRDNLAKITDLINKQSLNEYIKIVVGFSFDANKYFNDSEPWKYKKTDPNRMNSILYTISEQIKNISILLNPIIPVSTKKVLDTININENEISITTITKDNVLKHDKEIKDLSILFRKIENDN